MGFKIRSAFVKVLGAGNEGEVRTFIGLFLQELDCLRLGRLERLEGQ